MKTYQLIKKRGSHNFNFKRILLLGSLLFTTFLGDAQTGIGASGSLHIFTQKMGEFISFGPLMEFGIKNKYSARVSFNFFLPHTSSGTVVGYYAGSGNGQTVTVAYTNKYGIMTFAFDVKKYIRKTDGFNTGGFYAGLGLGLFLENLKTTYSPYDSQKYYIREANYSTNYDQVMFKGFGGYEFVYNFGVFFLETQLILPTNSTNADGISVVEVPVSLEFKYGYKYIIK